MKKLLVFLAPLLSLTADCQVVQVVHLPSITKLLSYSGTAQKVHISATDDVYVLCNPCISDSIAGAGNKKWQKITSHITGRSLADDSLNKVGINNANPAYTLDVTGDINATGTFRVNGIPLNNGSITSNDTVFSTTGRSKILGYNNYTVSLTQSGATPPVIRGIDTMITGVIWERTAPGIYTATKQGAFIIDKTSAPEIWTDTLYNIFKIVRTNANVITLTTYSATDTSVPADGVLNNTWVTFRVYNYFFLLLLFNRKKRYTC